MKEVKIVLYIYTFLVSGFVPERREGRIALGEFKSRARAIARRVVGHDSHVGRQVWFKDRWGNKWYRSLTIYEYAFGWTERNATACELSQPLVSWLGHEGEGRYPEIKIHTHHASEFDVASDEIIQFVRNIVTADEWTIVNEEPAKPARRQMAGVDD